MTIREDLPSAYRKLWQDFARGLCRLFRDIETWPNTAENGGLHELFKQLYGVPYHEIRICLQEPPVDGTSENIGPVTGLFFEQLIVAITVPFIRRAVPAATFERNQCSDSAVRGLSRDPDLHVSLGNRRVVFEFKVSPKKPELDSVLAEHARYTGAGVGYYFVGGYVAANAELLQSFSGGWACFAECSLRNERVLAGLPSLDTVLANAVTYLGSA